MNREPGRTRIGLNLDRLDAEVRSRVIGADGPDRDKVNAGVTRPVGPAVHVGRQAYRPEGRPMPAQLVVSGLAGLSGAGAAVVPLALAALNFSSSVYLLAGFLAAGGGALLFATVLVLGVVLRPVVIKPARYPAEQVRGQPPAAGQFATDPPWLLYPFRQAGIDRRVVRTYLLLFSRRSLAYFRVFPLAGSLLFSFSVIGLLAGLLFLPIALTGALLLLAVVLVAWCCYAVYWLVSIALTYVSRSVVDLAAAFLRLLDAPWRRARILCPNCYESTEPVYQCPRCGRDYRDIHPGLYGLLSWRCQCGMRLPARASQASRRLQAFCSRCGHPLQAGPAAVREIWIPVAGASSAGKTRFLYTALDSIIRSAGQAGLTVSFPDEESGQLTVAALEAIRSGQATPKSLAADPSVLAIRLEGGRKTFLLRMFDTSVERYQTAGPGNLNILSRAQELVYVLDPFSIPAVRDQLTTRDTLDDPPASTAGGDPEIPFGEFVSRMRDSGVPAGTQRLAVVVSKADLLNAAGMELPRRSSDIASWLTGAGLHNMVLAAGRDFAQVRFFAVTSQAGPGDGPVVQADPAAPLRWLLAASGIRLPSPAASPQRPEPGPAGPDSPSPRPQEHANTARAGYGEDHAPSSGASGGTLTLGASPEDPPPGAPPPPGRDPAGQAASQPRRRYLRGQYPDTVPVGKPFSLLVSVVLSGAAGHGELDPFDVPPEGRDVLLSVHAPGLRLLGSQRQTVHVPMERDSRPVMFELRADAPGPRQVSVTAWLDGSYLGELLVEVTAEDSGSHGPDRDVRAEVNVEPAVGAVSLVVRYDPGQKSYRFEFRDEDAPDEVISNLAYDPRPLVEQLIADLDRIAKGRSGYSSAQVRDYLVNAGARLWSQLVPAQLREQFWDRQHRIRQLTILADKDVVPWELLYPMDPGHDAGFLVEQFPVNRAVFRWLPSRILNLQPARFVLSGTSLSGAQQEVDAMRQLLGPAEPPDETISSLTQLQELISKGDFGLLHFACHNTFDPAVGLSIPLDDAPFTPTLMSVAAINKTLSRSAPTIFINACRSAGLAATYNQLDGWASSFLEAGAGAFIGSLWAVSDRAAHEFAHELYAQLRTGCTLGMAAMRARQAAAEQLDDPTWLAYAVYGSPNAAIRGRTM